MTSSKLNLSLVPAPLREQALESWAEGDILGIMISIDNQVLFQFIYDNLDLLMDKGFFEVALLNAYTACRVNWSSVSKDFIRFLFSLANRERLLSAGSPLPGNGPFVVYRGVAGVGAKRRVRGISWTADYDKAAWFATRYELPKPSVFKAVVPIENVYAYCNEREEQEFLCKITSDIKLKKYNITM